MYSLLLSLAAILIATKLLGELARKFSQSSMLGALVAGVFLGDGALALVDPRDPTIRALAQLGVLVLVFQIGLRTQMGSLRRARMTTISFAVAAVFLPFAAGFGVTHLLGYRVVSSLIAGAVVAATSIGISARILSDAGVHKTKEADMALAAALASDVFGVLVLSVLGALDTANKVDAGAVAKTSAFAALFVVAAMAVGSYAIPPLFRVLNRIRGRDSVGLFGISFAILLAAIAAFSGLATIIGAFLAGAILQSTESRGEVDRTATSLGHLLVPVFFAYVGASLQLHVAVSSGVLVLAGALASAAIAAKLAAGYAAWNFRGNKLLIGGAIIPPGEAGLILASIAFPTAAMTPDLFAALVIAVFVTTLLAPPIVRMIAARDEELERDEHSGPAILARDGRRQTSVGRKH